MRLSTGTIQNITVQLQGGPNANRCGKQKSLSWAKITFLDSLVKNVLSVLVIMQNRQNLSLHAYLPNYTSSTSPLSSLLPYRVTPDALLLHVEPDYQQQVLSPILCMGGFNHHFWGYDIEVSTLIHLV